MKARVAPLVLVVDDNADLADGLAVYLKGEGYEVATVYDGIDALTRAHELSPAVVILDIGLPGKSGHQVAAELRQDRVSGKALIIGVSGYGLLERERALEAGIDHFFVKPADPEHLISLIKSSAKM